MDFKQLDNSTEYDMETMTFLDEGLSNIIEKKIMFINDPTNNFATDPFKT